MASSLYPTPSSCRRVTIQCCLSARAQARALLSDFDRAITRVKSTAANFLPHSGVSVGLSTRAAPNAYKPWMDIGFGEAVLRFGGLLAVVAALSGLIRGTVLSASVLSVGLGIAIAA